MDHNSTDYEQLQKDAERSLSSMKTFETINKVHLYFLLIIKKKTSERCIDGIGQLFWSPFRPQIHSRIS